MNEEFFNPLYFGVEVETLGKIKKRRKVVVFDGQGEIGGIKKNDNDRVDLLKDEQKMGETMTGFSIYRNEDMGEMYAFKKIKGTEEKCLLEQTPEKDRYYLSLGTNVQQYDENDRFKKGGYIYYEEPIVKRVLDENKKLIIKDGYFQYMALVELYFSFLKGDSNERIYLSLKPGEKFFASKSGEKKKEIVKKIKEIK